MTTCVVRGLLWGGGGKGERAYSRSLCDDEESDLSILKMFWNYK